MPAATKYYVESVDPTRPEQPPTYAPRYEKGFSLGFVGSDKIPGTAVGSKYINNHVRLTVHIHDNPALFAGYRVVGFEVEPFSVKHQFETWSGKTTQLNTCNPLNKVTHELPPQLVSDPAQNTIVFTYDVQFERTDIKWASRWDMYLKMSDARIHWFSIINSIVIVLFLSGMVAMIMIRTLHRDLLRYNSVLTVRWTELNGDKSPSLLRLLALLLIVLFVFVYSDGGLQLAEDREAAEEETGWKLVHGDVFRAPQRAGSLCVLVGAGSQVRV